MIRLMIFVFSRTSSSGYGVRGLGVGGGERVGWGCRKISKIFPGDFPEISTGLERVPRYKNDIATRQLKMFGHGLHERNSMIILVSPGLPRTIIYDRFLS